MDEQPKTTTRRTNFVDVLSGEKHEIHEPGMVNDAFTKDAVRKGQANLKGA